MLIKKIWRMALEDSRLTPAIVADEITEKGEWLNTSEEWSKLQISLLNDVCCVEAYQEKEILGEVAFDVEYLVDLAVKGIIDRHLGEHAYARAQAASEGFTGGMDME